MAAKTKTAARGPGNDADRSGARGPGSEGYQAGSSPKPSRQSSAYPIRPATAPVKKAKG